MTIEERKALTDEARKLAQGAVDRSDELAVALLAEAVDKLAGAIDDMNGVPR